MIETASNIVRDALTEITVQAQEQSLPAVDLNTGIRYLNRMMTALDADGVKLGYTIVDSPNDPITVPAGAIEGMVFMLAMRLANGFDIAVSPALSMNADQGKAIMYKLGVTIGKTNLPSALPIGSGNGGDLNSYDGQLFFYGCCEDQDTCEDDPI